MSIPFSLHWEDVANIFKRDDIRGIWPDELNCDIVQHIGKIFADMLHKPDDHRAIVVGHDARRGSYELLCALCNGIESTACTVVNIGLCSSEQIYFMAGQHPERFKGGAMITASHNPSDYNGIKFVHAGALPFSSTELLDMRERLKAAFTPRTASPVNDEFAHHMFALSGFAKARNSKDIPLKVVVMAGCGVGAEVFRPLGELLTPKGFEFIYAEDKPDGSFPNGVPNPLNSGFNRRLGNYVKQNKADIGIGFDGDADRAGFVDAKGKPLIPSQVLAIVALSKLAENKTTKNRPIIMRNLCCSHLLEELFNDASGVELIDTPVGHGQIKQLMRCEQYKSRVIFAGEHSGHYFYPEFFSVDSGILTSLFMLRHLKTLKAQEKTLDMGLKKWRTRYLWSGEINFRMPDSNHVSSALDSLSHFAENTSGRQRFSICKDPATGLARVFETTTAPKKTAAPDIKVQCTNPDGSGWWFVLRPSGNEPILRLNVETWSQPRKELDHLVDILKKTLINLGANPA
ncbi:MAG: hypothetical protein J6X55_10015 [Victivallales bacterium]|nr:hypothetical protein [Victivallales bacterium]